MGLGYLKAIKKAIAELNIACENCMVRVQQIKTESEQPKIPKELKETWEREDREIAIKTNQAPKPTYISQSLKTQWAKEDQKAALREDEETDKPELLPKSLTKEELERHWEKEDAAAKKYREARGE